MRDAASGRVAFGIEHLFFRYADASRDAISDIALDVPTGSLLGVIGPNGSGKSTLLRLLIGALLPAAGAVRYDGRDVDRWNRRALARSIGVVAQRDEMLYPMTVRELVAMGRYPHLGPWRREGTADRVAIEQAMERCSVADLAERLVDHLSGGELQRARIARALAQQPSTLMLDEPTAQLDIAHEMAIFELLAGLCRDDGATIILVTHNLNLAARHATALLLLDRGRLVAHGPPAAVLTEPTLDRVYGWPIRVVPHPGPGADTGAPQVVPLTKSEAVGRPPGSKEI